MTTGEEPGYLIEFLPKVNAQIHALAEKADALGIGMEFVLALKTVVEQLKTRPLEWSDPEHRTRKKGGCVCHGISPPLYIRFVVYQEEEYVCLLDLRPMPGSPLE